jgi:hypothetical protein
MVLQTVKDCIFDDASQYATRWHEELPHDIWVSESRSARSWDTRRSSWYTD